MKNLSPEYFEQKIAEFGKIAEMSNVNPVLGLLKLNEVLQTIYLKGYNDRDSELNKLAKNN